MDIKDVIHSKRIEHGMTMKDLAKAVGVSEGTISRWESGEISNMRRDKVARLLVRAFGTATPDAIHRQIKASQVPIMPSHVTIRQFLLHQSYT